MRITTHKLYWTTADGKVCSETHTNLVTLLKACELQRQNKCLFISHASEYGDEVVGKQGVDVVGSDYNWKKRRP